MLSSLAQKSLLLQSIMIDYPTELLYYVTSLLSRLVHFLSFESRKEACSIRLSHYVILNNRPCRLFQITSQKNKYLFAGRNIFTNDMNWEKFSSKAIVKIPEIIHEWKYLKDIDYKDDCLKSMIFDTSDNSIELKIIDRMGRHKVTQVRFT